MPHRQIAYSEAMKSHFLRSASVLSLLIAGPAIAADMPLKAPALSAPAFSWTGFYVGLNAGGTWARFGLDTSLNCQDPSVNQYLCSSNGAGAANASAVNAAGSGTIHASGFTGGIQAGYNWQASNLIYGLETDFGAFHLRGSRLGTGTNPVDLGLTTAGHRFAVSSSVSTDWLFTLRGRLGVAVAPNLMAYATGGLAVTRLSVNNSFSDDFSPAATGSANAAATRAGWVAGGGLEYALAHDWSVKAEYLYMDFGHVTATGTIFATQGYSQGISTSSDLTAHVARLGVNRRF